MGLVAAICMAGLAAFFLRSEWEKLQLAETLVRLKTAKPLGYPPQAKAGEEKLRLLFISDLHEYAPVMHRLERVMEQIRQLKPDAVLVGGDFLTVNRHGNALPEQEAALSFLYALSREYAVYYGEGNHEVRLRRKHPEVYEQYVSSLRKYGITYLSDQSAVLRIGETETKVILHGISLEESFFQPSPGFGLRLKLPEGYLERKLPDFDREAFHIFLLHAPAFLKEAAAYGADLVLSGHMHGGIIRLPGGGGLSTPQYRLFVKECSGTFREGNCLMAVTRGLGTHSIKIRCNDLPELMLVEIEGGKTAITGGRAEDRGKGTAEL